MEMEKNKISLDWYEEFALAGRAIERGAVKKEKYYRAYVHREVHGDGEWNDENLITAGGFDELVKEVGGLDCFSSVGVEDVFTQINEGAVFGRSERNNFSYVVDLEGGRRRQNYMFTLDELTRFRNELRKILEKR